MKRLAIVLGILVPLATVAQKEIKPSLPKAEKALRENKLDEAKAIIDLSVSNQDFMVDKKGNPSKNAAKAWYLKGLIYAAIDTTKSEQFKSLDSNPFVAAKEAFEKCKEIDKDKTGSFINDASGFPMLTNQVNSYLAQAYFDKAVKSYQDSKDYKKAFQYTEQTLYFIPEDTSILMNAGVFFAPAAEEYDKGIMYINKYIEKGGTSADAYLMLFDIYYSKKKSNEDALKVIKDARAKFPNNSDFPKYELNIYLMDKKYDVAKQMVAETITANPEDKESHYLMGQLEEELGNVEGARASFKKAVDIDPKYFDAAARLANIYWNEAKAVKDEMGKLGNSKADLSKLQALDKTYVEKLKIYLPYIEYCEKLSPDDVNVLYPLLNIYTELDDQPKIQRIKKKLKSLGEDID